MVITYKTYDMATIKETLKIPRWDIEEETGYKPITTFWMDFSIADNYGLQAIQGTFNRAFDAWKGDYKYLTELVLVLNHKIFHHYVEKGTEEQNEVASLYNELWRKTNDYALDNLQGEQATYFYHLTD